MKIGIKINCLLENSNFDEQREIIEKLKKDGHSVCIVLNMDEYDGAPLVDLNTENEIHKGLLDLLKITGVSYDELIMVNEDERDICVKHNINFMISDVLCEETYKSVSKLTGFPSIDKPWLKYYSDDQLNMPIPKMFMYDYLYNCRKNDLQDNSFNYLGIKSSIEELFNNIDKVAASLVSQGIKAGDTIAMCLPTTPEALYLLYAVNKIGAISNIVDPRKEIDDLEYCLNVGGINKFGEISKAKCIFTIDALLPRLEKILDNTEIQKVFSISPVESLPKFKKVLYNIANPRKKCILDKPTFTWDEFITMGNDIKSLPNVDYKPQQLALIQYTSGSTGKPKPVGLSNETINLRVQQYKYGGMTYEKEQKYYNIIPIFLAFGAVVGIHLPLSLGLTDVIDPAYDIRKTFKNIKKIKPEHMTLTPSGYDYLVNDRNYSTSKIDLSFLHTLGCGGDGDCAEKNRIKNEKLSQNNCSEKIRNGYGASEVGAPFSTEKKDVYVDGSVGIPLVGNNIRISDIATGKHLSYNEIGYITMIVKYPMIGYINNKELTSSVMKQINEDTFEITLGDVGYINQDGFLFVKGRLENAIENDNGQLIWPGDIENDIMLTGYVRNCAVIKSATEKGIGYCHIMLKDDCKKFSKQIEEQILLSLISNSKYCGINFDISIVDTINLTSSGKILRKAITPSLEENNERKLCYTN